MRAALEREAARRAGGDRPHLPRRDDLAGADPRLHREEAWAARDAERALRASRTLPADPGQMARRGAGGANGRRSGACARSVTGAIEIARAAKEIGSSLEAHPIVYIGDPKLAAALEGVDFAEVCITSDLTIETGAQPPASAFRSPDAPGVAVVVGARARRQMRALLALFRSRDRRSRISRRDPARRRGAARTRRDAAGVRRARILGAMAALVVLALDQASKFAVVHGFGVTDSRPDPLAPFLDLALALESPAYRSACSRSGRGLGVALLLGFTLVATLALGRLALARAGAARRAGPGRDHRRRARQRAAIGWPMARWSISSTCTRSGGISSSSTSPTPRSMSASRCW